MTVCSSAVGRATSNVVSGRAESKPGAESMPWIETVPVILSVPPALTPWRMKNVPSVTMNG